MVSFNGEEGIEGIMMIPGAHDGEDFEYLQMGRTAQEQKTLKSSE
jgi:hypothetical protein